MAVKRINPIRTYLKRQKKTFAEEIALVLAEENDLTAREICSRIYDKSKSKLIDRLTRQHITNITKDFNDRLTARLEKLNVVKYYNEEEEVFKYKKEGWYSR